MPRKKRKTTVLDKVEVPDNKSELQKAIVAKLDGLPPTIYAITAETLHQKAAWVTNKQYFKRVGAIIDSYFNGVAPPDLTYMPKAQKEDVWNTAWRYLTFYSMVWASWDAVRDKLSQGLTPPMPLAWGNGVLGRPVTTQFELLETPIAVTLEVLQYRAISQMVDAFAVEVDYVPDRERTWIENARKARRADASKDVKNQFQEDVTARILERPWSYLECLCTQAVVDSKPEKNTTAEKTLKNFLEAHYAGEALTLKVNHRRNVAGKPRYTFREGVLISKCP